MTAARGRRLEPDQRREEILDAAVLLFGRRSYADVSTVEIAASAGVARGLLNHYFGTKRELYLEVVRRLVTLPDTPDLPPLSGPLRLRVECSVEFFLDRIAQHGTAFVAAIGAEGVAGDPAIERILAEADDAAARQVLAMIGLDPAPEAPRAVLRAYGGLVKMAIREWIRGGTLTREQVTHLLVEVLLTVVTDVLPSTVLEGVTDE